MRYTFIISGREGPGAASPGRALQGVKDKLSAFMAKQQLQEQRLQQQQQLPGESDAALQVKAPTQGSLGACYHNLPC